MKAPFTLLNMDFILYCILSMSVLKILFPMATEVPCEILTHVQVVECLNQIRRISLLKHFIFL
jgi:hypothetical protein